MNPSENMTSSGFSACQQERFARSPIAQAKWVG